MTYLKINNQELRDLIRPVLPFRGRGDGPPIFEAIHLTSYDGYVEAECVHGSRFARCRRPVADVVPGFDVVVPADELPLSGHGPEVVWEFLADEQWMIADETGHPERMIPLHPVAQFPSAALSRKFRAAVTGRTGTSTRLHPGHLEALLAAASADNHDNDPMVLYPGGSPFDPVLAVCGRHFIAVLTPATIHSPRVSANAFRPQPLTVEPLDVWTEQLNPQGE